MERLKSAFEISTRFFSMQKNFNLLENCSQTNNAIRDAGERGK